MGQTIIDSLIVKLGLDSKDVDSKTPNVDRKLKDIEKGADKTETSFKNLSKSIGAFLAIIGGTSALKSFVLQTIESSAALDRLSKNLNLNVSTISAWGNAVEEVGGNAKGLQGTMSMLSRSQTELRLTGQSSLIPYFSALGISLATVEGRAKPVDQILLELADRFSRMDRTTANNMGQMMGIDQDTMNLLLKGRRELELTIKRQKEHNAVTKQQAEEASKMQKTLADTKQGFAALGRTLLEQATPYLEKFLESLMSFGNWLNSNSQFVKDFAIILGSVAAGFALIALATSPITLTVAAVVALAGAIAVGWVGVQTWKRGGDSFIDWGKWEPAITGATNGVKMLAGALESAFNWYTKLYEKVTGQSFKANFGAGTDAIEGFLGVKPIQSDMNGRNETISAAGIKKFFTDRGWTNEQASGIASNVMSESGGKMRASGDGGKAFGLAQWHSDRQAAFAQWAGHDIRTATLEEQLGFIQYELTQGSERSPGNALKGAKTASDAGSILSRQYERPADANGEAKRRGDLASTLAGVAGASTALASAGSSRGGGSTTDDHSVETHIGEIKVYTAATDANGLARDLGKSMNYLFASQANGGLQ